jgi:hypothetical protein
MLESAEKLAGKKYTHVFRHRPDVLYHSPVPARFAQAEVVLYKYDISGVCPRAMASEAWPCAIPNGNGRGDPKMQPTELFVVSFERMGDEKTSHVSENERQFEWAWWFHGSLRKYAEQQANATLLANAGMNYAASLCFAYDVRRYNWLFEEMKPLDTFYQTGTDWASSAPPAACDGEALEKSGFTGLLHGSGGVAGTLIAALDAFEKDVGFGAGHWRQHDASPPYGDIGFLNTMCGCRWRVCGQGVTDGVPPGALRFTQELCSRAFTTQLTSRRYMYRPPSLYPQFGALDFEESFKAPLVFK